MPAPPPSEKSVIRVASRKKYHDVLQSRPVLSPPEKTGMDLVRATRARCAPEQHSPDAHGHGASVGHNGRNRGSVPGPRHVDVRSSALA